MEGFGQKSYDNLIDSLERAKDTTLPRVIYSLGIANIGLANAKVICRHFDNDLEKIRHAELEEVSDIDTIGPVIAGNLVAYFRDEDDVQSNSSKNKKARELEIPILSEGDFLKLAGR